MIKITATHAFALSVARLRRFLSFRYSSEVADQTLSAAEAKVIRVLSEYPDIAPFSERLMTLGIGNYRQWQIDDHNLLFYSYDSATQTIELLLIIDSRQDIQQALFELSLRL